MSDKTAYELATTGEARPELLQQVEEFCDQLALTDGETFAMMTRASLKYIYNGLSNPHLCRFALSELGLTGARHDFRGIHATPEERRIMHDACQQAVEGVFPQPADLLRMIPETNVDGADVLKRLFSQIRMVLCGASIFGGDNPEQWLRETASEQG